MKLSSKQLHYIVQEIYEKVSRPIIEENEEKIKKVKIPITTYQKAAEKVEILKNEIVKLEEEIDKLNKTFDDKKVEGIFTGYRSSCESYTFESWLNLYKRKKANLKEAPTYEDIERRVVLSSNSDIPELLQEVIKYFQNS